MSGILIGLFVGITLLARQIAAVPSHTETVISQLARTVHGPGTILYVMTMAGTALILLMAANTSYADFPRLAALHAGDGFLPRQLTFRGSRLVFSWGIMVLAGMASLLVVVTGASVSTLIPLYAVGVFLSFTVSQTGMAVRLWKSGHLKAGESLEGLETSITYDTGWKHKIVISAFGALSTGVVMIVFAVTKFVSGAWLVVVLIPILVLIFFRIHRHYKAVANSLSMTVNRPVVEAHPVKTLILVDHVHAGTVELVDFAKSLGHPWHAIHIDVNPDKTQQMKKQWDEYVGEGEIELIDSPYRQLAYPLRDYIKKMLDEAPDSYVHVIMGHLAMDTFWEQALHQNSVLLFNVALTNMERVVVTIVPYQIHRAKNHEYVAAGNFARQPEPPAEALTSVE